MKFGSWTYDGFKVNTVINAFLEIFRVKLVHLYLSEKVMSEYRMVVRDIIHI